MTDYSKHLSQNDEHEMKMVSINELRAGDDDFVNNMQCKLNPEQSLKDIPKKQKQAPANSMVDPVVRSPAAHLDAQYSALARASLFPLLPEQSLHAERRLPGRYT